MRPSIGALQRRAGFLEQVEEGRVSRDDAQHDFFSVAYRAGRNLPFGARQVVAPGTFAPAAG